jgi:hypothetical protein
LYNRYRVIYSGIRVEVVDANSEEFGLYQWHRLLKARVDFGFCCMSIKETREPVIQSRYSLDRLSVVAFMIDC